MLVAAKGTLGFAAQERTLLQQFGVNLNDPPAQTKLNRLAIGSGALLTGAMASILMFAAWFGLVSEIYVSQFLVHDWTHWINHPLIQLPWTGSIFWPR